MSFSFSSIFSEAESFIAEASNVAAAVPAEVAAATTAAANALETAKAAASSLETALNSLKGLTAPAAPASSAS